MSEILLAVILLLQLAMVALWVRDGGGGRRREEFLDRIRQELLSTLQSELRNLREENLQQAKLGREELAGHLARTGEGISRTVNDHFTAHSLQQKNLFDSLFQQLGQTSQMMEARLERIRGVVDERLQKLQEDNAAKLEQMRQTVDEKLHATLENRLAESFKQVSERLEAVHKGLGEMQSLATSVGDLKRVLTNVKTRGTFGEVQLQMLLEQILSPEQYATNVATKLGSNDRVEFAIRLPGRGEGDAPVYLPIDCKFPMEDYRRMVDAQEIGDAAAVAEASKALVSRIRTEARAISGKYLDPPHTTEFAIMYLPLEGLFAEVLRQPGLMEAIQQEYRVVVAGPTTLTALLTSLQMGFRTLAIQRRSSEVWELLGAIKTQFGTFGELLSRTKKKLEEASSSIDSAASRSRAIERRLKAVEELPVDRARNLLPPPGEEPEGPLEATAP